jgi:glycerol-3-phosphate acyltransferase PlsX
VKEQKVDAFVSAGNTGALLAGATLIVGRIKGIERPALGAMLPTGMGTSKDGKFSLLIDCGANVDAKPAYLAQFGKMGAVYMETVRGIAKPSVGLINIGAEKEKGNALTKEAYALLENDTRINFIGKVEAREIPNYAADVLVCDAFTGNVLLKYTEGFAKSIFGLVKAEMTATAMTKVGALLAKGAFRNIKNKFDYDDIGGAPFLGLNGLVVKAHGSSSARAIKGAIGQCIAFVENDFITGLQSKL